MVTAYQEALTRIREHAKIIQEYLNTPPEEAGKTYLYRSLVMDSSDYLFDVRALTLIIPWKGLPAGQVQRRHSGSEPSVSKLNTGLYITATELAVFFGLEDIAPEDIQWVRQEVS